MSSAAFTLEMFTQSPEPCLGALLEPFPKSAAPNTLRALPHSQGEAMEGAGLHHTPATEPVSLKT